MWTREAIEFVPAAVTTPACPVCGQPMRQTRRGATLAKRGPAYVCPADEAEVTVNERGHRVRAADGVHPLGVRSWQAWELRAA